MADVTGLTSLQATPGSWLLTLTFSEPSLLKAGCPQALAADVGPSPAQTRGQNRGPSGLRPRVLGELPKAHAERLADGRSPPREAARADGTGDWEGHGSPGAPCLRDIGPGDLERALRLNASASRSLNEALATPPALSCPCIRRIRRNPRAAVAR